MPIVTADPHPNPHADDSMVGPHGSMADHGETHGHDDHAHAGTPTLGPLNARALAAALVGILLGFAVALAMARASGSWPF